MTALSADKERATRGRNTVHQQQVAVTTAVTIYIGSLLNFVTSTGRVRPASAATSRVFAGVCTGFVNDTGAAISAITGNTAGTVKAIVEWGHEALVSVATAARTSTTLSKNVYASDDDTVTDTTGAGTAGVQVRVGMLTAFEASNKSTGWVALRVFSQSDAA